jgi:lysine 6-dehydrogenase
MRAIVLGGAGAVCKETTRDLSAYSTFGEITVADRDLAAAEGLIASIGDARLQPLTFDADDYDSMLAVFPQYDVVVNGLPYQYDYSVNKACVEAGVNGLDLSSDDPQFELHCQAEKKGMIFVPGMGATPGITNLMVRRGSEVMDKLRAVEIYFAAFRCLAPAPGLLSTTLWEFNPEEEDRQAVYFQDGNWHAAPPLSGETLVRFHEQIGEQKVYYVPHDEANTLPRSFPGLTRAAVRGCFPPHVMEVMTALFKAGLLSNRKIPLGDQEMTAIQAVRSLLADSPFSQINDNWGYGLVVEVLGERDGQQVKAIYRSQHPPAAEWGGESAYFKNVGIPLSIGAQLIASGLSTAYGVQPPETALPVGPFFSALATRGITVEETVIIENQLAEYNRL